MITFKIINLSAEYISPKLYMILEIGDKLKFVSVCLILICPIIFENFGICFSL